MVEYTEGICGDAAVVLKDGHVMFIEDIVKDLRRKAFLEEKYKDQKKSTILTNRVERAAKKALRNPNSSKKAKTAAGSALSQPRRKG